MPLELDQTTPDMSQPTDTPIGAQPGEIDREGGMAKQDLTKIASYAEKLDARLQDTDQLEAWVQKKIAVASENLASVYHYLAYEMTVNEYAECLRKNGLLSEGANHPAVRKLMEAKAKIKELKKAQIEKKTGKKVSEGALSGGERTCTECGGSGMVYEEPKAIPDHVKTKAQKYNTMMKATKAAHKRMDANHNGVPDEDEIAEDSTEDTTKTTKTQHGTATATFGADGQRKGVKHTDERKYSDGGDDMDTDAKSGKGTKSHAKSQSAAEKKEKAPAQKQSPKSAKTWGMKNSEKFDNRDKEKEVDETYGQGVYEASGDKKKCPPMSHIKKMCKDGKSLAEICKMHPDCDQKELKQMVADCKNKLGESAKYRDPKYKDKLYTQEPRDYYQYDYGDDDYYNPKPDDYPGAKNIKGGGEFDHNDPLRKGYGRHGTGSMNTHGKRKGMPSRDQISSLKGSIKAAHGTHPRPNLPEAAAAMWKNIKETTAYMAEKKAIEKKDKPMKGDKIADEGNAVTGGLADKNIPIGSKIPGTDVIKKKQIETESSDFTRMQEQLARLNRSETKTSINENSEVNRLRTLTNLFKG